MRRIACITNNRADESPMGPLIKALGNHARPIRTSGLHGHETALLSILRHEKPDIVCILGDRYEALTAASVATLCNIPIAHLSGGDITLGSADNAYRDAISKLAYWHFPGHTAAAERLADMGEDTARIFPLGYPALDNLAGEMTIEEVDGHRFIIDYPRPQFLFAWLPETFGHSDVREVLKALEGYPEATILACGSNADPGGEEITKRIQAWAKKRPNVRFANTYPLRLWLGLMKAADCCIGNSSAFVIEAPALGTPSVVIGTRQIGRLMPDTVITATAHHEAIIAGIHQALTLKREKFRGFGEIGKIAPAIACKLLEVEIPRYPIKYGQSC